VSSSGRFYAHARLLSVSRDRRWAPARTGTAGYAHAEMILVKVAGTDD
jgi:hypothetical protein